MDAEERLVNRHSKIWQPKFIAMCDDTLDVDMTPLELVEFGDIAAACLDDRAQRPDSRQVCVCCACIMTSFCLQRDHSRFHTWFLRTRVCVCACVCVRARACVYLKYICVGVLFVASICAMLLVEVTIDLSCSRDDSLQIM